MRWHSSASRLKSAARMEGETIAFGCSMLFGSRAAAGSLFLSRCNGVGAWADEGGAIGREG